MQYKILLKSKGSYAYMSLAGLDSRGRPKWTLGGKPKLFKSWDEANTYAHEHNIMTGSGGVVDYVENR